MLTRLRRFAGLLVALFVGHLALVAHGDVCAVPAMSAMTGVMESGQPMAMSSVNPRLDASSDVMAMPAESTAPASPSDAPQSSDDDCSQPVSGICPSPLQCVTALGAYVSPLADVRSATHDQVLSLAVLMPVTARLAPELPPPRA